MKLWTLSSILRKNVFLQYILAFLPVVVIPLYLICYILDLSNIVGVLDNNDRFVVEAQCNNALREVQWVEDGVVRVSGDYSYDIDVSYGDIIFSVYVVSPNRYEYVLSDNVLYASSTDLISSIKENNGSYEIEIVDDYKLTIGSGDRLCTVSVSADGYYIVDYGGYSFKTDYLSNVGVLNENDGVYSLCVSTSYNEVIENPVINFCRVLPSNELYFDTSNMGLIQNVSNDFVFGVIISSNICLVMFYLMVYLIILSVVINKIDDLVVLSKTCITSLNVVCMFGLILAFLSTFVII